MTHSNAFGIRFKKQDLNNIINKCNELQPLDSLQVVHDADWEIPAKMLKKEYVSEVANQYEIWGNTIPEPTFVITNLVIPAAEINVYGEHNGFIRFVYNGVVFTKKYCPATDYDKMICKSRVGIGKPKYKVKLNIICQFVLNVWEEKVNPEVKILYFDSMKYDESSELDDWLDNNDNGKHMDNTSSTVSNSVSNRITKSTSTSSKKLKAGQQIIKMSKVEDEDKDEIEVKDNKIEEKLEEPPKKKRGRPPKKPLILDDEDEIEVRPKKKEEKKIEEKVDNSKKKVYNIDDDFDW